MILSQKLRRKTWLPPRKVNTQYPQRLPVGFPVSSSGGSIKVVRHNEAAVLIAQREMIMTRRRCLIALVVVVVSGVPVGLARSGDFQPISGFASYRAHRQAFAWSRETVMSSSTDWMPLTMSGPARSRGHSSVDVSMNVTGAPVEIRAVWEGRRRAFRPGKAYFDPTAGTKSFSYRFVDTEDRRPACRHFQAQWRSASGGTATVTHASAVLDYSSAKRRGRQLCDVH